MLLYLFCLARSLFAFLDFDRNPGTDTPTVSSCTAPTLSQYPGHCLMRCCLCLLKLYTCLYKAESKAESNSLLLRLSVLVCRIHDSKGIPQLIFCGMSCFGSRAQLLSSGLLETCMGPPLVIPGHLSSCTCYTVVRNGEQLSGDAPNQLNSYFRSVCDHDAWTGTRGSRFDRWRTYRM